MNFVRVIFAGSMRGVFEQIRDVNEQNKRSLNIPGEDEISGVASMLIMFFFAIRAIQIKTSFKNHFFSIKKKY
jgi:hypothetical protein